MIHIVDYGLGNIRAFANVYRHLNVRVVAARSPEDLRNATHIILPGVGHFDHALERLEHSGMRPVLEESAVHRKVPVLGVCVGMQMLARSSDEGTRPGLGWIDGHVRAFSNWEQARTLPMPHMGWNDVRPRSTAGLFSRLGSECRFYFLHSYFFECRDAADVLAESEYGAPFACAVRRENILGVQFHPEKSHHWGTQLLRSFSEL